MSKLNDLGGEGSDEKRLTRLAQLIKVSKHCVILTGAGVSTESGIPDFRSPGTGLWTKVDPMYMLSDTAFRTNPVEFYKFINGMVENFNQAEPNACHKAIVDLEKNGHVKAVITQNIDNLHRRVGTKNILEVHGNTVTGRCLDCGKVFPMDDILDRVRSGDIPPLCNKCKGSIKPDIVLFEDPLPLDFVLAKKEASDSDLFIVIGSSLQVAPVCYLPVMSKNYVIINLQPTPYDSGAQLIIRGRAGEVTSKVRDIVLDM